MADGKSVSGMEGPIGRAITEVNVCRRSASADAVADGTCLRLMEKLRKW